MGHQREVLPDCEIPYFLLVLALDILRSRGTLITSEEGCGLGDERDEKEARSAN